MRTVDMKGMNILARIGDLVANDALKGIYNNVLGAQVVLGVSSVF